MSAEDDDQHDEDQHNEDEHNEDATDSSAGPPRGQGDRVNADEGEPDVAPFAGDEETLAPSPSSQSLHGYGYQ